MQKTPGTAAINSKALIREALFFPDGKAGMLGQQKLQLWAPRSHPQNSISSTVGGSGTEGQVTSTSPWHKGLLALCAKLRSKHACLWLETHIMNSSRAYMHAELVGSQAHLQCNGSFSCQRLSSSRGQ